MNKLIEQLKELKLMKSDLENSTDVFLKSQVEKVDVLIAYIENKSKKDQLSE